MKKNNNAKNYKFLILFITLSVIVFSYGCFLTYKYLILTSTSDNVFKNIYLEQYDLSDCSYDEVKNKIDYYNDSILSQSIDLVYNDKKINVSYKELGLSIDVDSIIKEIKDYQNGLSYNDRIKLSEGKNKIFKIKYLFNKDVCTETLNNIKANNDVAAVNGYFDTSNGVKFIKGSNGYSLNVLESVNEIEKEINGGLFKNSTINLNVEESLGNNNPSYENIDTLVSTFSTNFNVWEGTRPTNLRTGLSYINGAIVEPGEVFSFYKYAGPFNKRGYVFYYEFVGNGVCQIATTTYNAALLGGLEIVKRYPHAKKSVYVPGGLDATVASYSSGWYVDMQFKNTYKYPIYIKAYANGGTATVEFWSNSNAKEGKTYSTESEQIGARGYNSYLHVYDANGVEIEKRFIAKTWYTEG